MSQLDWSLGKENDYEFLTQNKARIVYLGNLPFSTKAEDIQSEFGSLGSIQEILLARDKENGAFIGFGYLLMKTEQEAAQMTDQLSGKTLKGREIYAQHLPYLNR